MLNQCKGSLKHNGPLCIQFFPLCCIFCHYATLLVTGSHLRVPSPYFFAPMPFWGDTYQSESILLYENSYIPYSYFRDLYKSPYKTEKHYKMYEIFFRHQFTSAQPHCQAVGRLEYEVPVPVTRISHVTHTKEAAEIRKSWMFRVTQKCGKCYEWNAYPMGESFQDCFLSPSSEMVELYPEYQMYKYVNSKESLLPGFYSWWGISSSDWTQREEKLKEYWMSPTCPGYLQEPPSSRYGNVEFSGELHKVLASYQTSRFVSSRKKPDVYLLIGGTLRYKCEICCVVIVCTGEDKESEALKDYRPLQHDSTPESNLNNPVFISNGLIDVTGKVIDFSGKNVPAFHPRFLSTSVNWANLAFAFYFEKSWCKLWCPKDKGVIQEQVIKHSHHNCIKKTQSSKHKPCVCPNREQHFKHPPKKLKY